MQFMKKKNNNRDTEILILKTQIKLSTHRVKVLKAFEDVNMFRPTEIALSSRNLNKVSWAHCH